MVRVPGGTYPPDGAKRTVYGYLASSLVGAAGAPMSSMRIRTWLCRSAIAGVGTPPDHTIASTRPSARWANPSHRR